MSSKTSFAEIIESSTTYAKLQAWHLGQCPPQGTLVLIEVATGPLFGIISSLTTGSPDGAAVVHPYRQTQEQLRADHPEVFELLQTTATCLLVGHMADGKLMYGAPGVPAPIHAFVRQGSRDECAQFFSAAQWVTVLCGHFQGANIPDELLLAVLARLHEQGLLGQNMLDPFLDTYAALTDGDYRHLRLFVQRVAQLVG